MNAAIPSTELDWVRRFDPNRRLLTGGGYRITKRLFDLFVVVISMPFWIPVMLLVALMIAVTSPGAPVFFVQPRTGKAGRRFSMYKFRTMVPNAEDLKTQY